MKRRAICLTFALLPLSAFPSQAAETVVTGDARFFQFVSFGEVAGERGHAELGISRLKVVIDWTDALRFEAHGVLQITSPATDHALSIASGATRRFFDLDYAFTLGKDSRGLIELDRLNLRWERSAFRLVIGRQTMTWGVNYFWPVLDLFAPFAPERVDREYKPGIDALRVTMPVGDFSEVEVAAAGQGRRFPEDFSLGSLGRFHVGGADLGYMGGRFHTDHVIGGFLTTDLLGMGVRAEAAFTESGDPRDAEIDRDRFVRASAGFDRLLAATLTLTAEAHYNGFGAKAPDGYERVAMSDRVSRGEIPSLGRYYTGVSLAWQAHPLLMVSGVGLTNWGDRSVLLQTTGEWSATQNIVIQAGGILGFGAGLGPEGQVGSEYGFVPSTLWGAFKVYF